jgi:hypothetical protein
LWKNSVVEIHGLWSCFLDYRNKTKHSCGRRTRNHTTLRFEPLPDFSEQNDSPGRIYIRVKKILESLLLLDDETQTYRFQELVDESQSAHFV